MKARSFAKETFAKALRIALTFALVFWCSFQAEAIAWAALAGDPGVGAHEPGTLSELTVWQLDKADSSRLGAPVRTARDTAAGKPQALEPLLGTTGPASQAHFVSVPTWSDGVSVTTDPNVSVIADFVEWASSNPEVASVEAAGGVATVTGHATGSVTITCRLKPEAAALVAPDLHPEASFTVQVRAPFISSIEIHGPDGALLDGAAEVAVPEDQRASYGLYARVNVMDPATGQPASYDLFGGQGLSQVAPGFADLAWRTSDPAVATVTNGTVQFLADGAVTVFCATEQAEGGHYETGVALRAEQAQPQPPTPVEPDVPADPQGEDHRQDTLTLTVDVPASVLEGDVATETTADAEAQSAEGASAGAASAGSEASGSSASADASSEAAAEPRVKSGTWVYTLDQLEAEPRLAYGGTSEHVMGDLTVTGQGPSLAQLLDFVGITVEDQPEISTVTFVDYAGNAHTVPWADLVAVSASPSAGADGHHDQLILAYRSRVTSSPDMALSAQDESSASAAAEQSGSAEAVQGDSQGSAEASQGAADASQGSADASQTSEGQASSGGSSPAAADDGQLLDNTRFRLLYHGLGAGELADPNAFRYINEIVVHMKEKEAPQPPAPKEYFAWISYNPVPKGRTAILSPRFELPAGNTFGFTWQVSNDGAEWVDFSEGGAGEGNTSRQTLEVPTDDEHIGKWYRFILNTDVPDESAEGGFRKVESEPVQITEGSGFVVNLGYVPPIAGDVANFTAAPFLSEEVDGKIVDKTGEIDLQKVEYTWEASEDGGATWSSEPRVLSSQSGPGSSTLRVQTSPVTDTGDESAEGGSDAPAATMVYIRVRAQYKGWEAISNPQPLTVRVGESGGDKSKDVEDELNNKDKPDDESTPTPTPTPTPTEPTTPTPTPTSAPTPHVNVSQIDSVVVEAPGGEVQPSPKPTQSSPSQVYVNEAVTEAVAEQQQQAQEEKMENVPGARWTQLASVNPSADDVSTIMAANPFAPFAVPLALGITAAGAVEKILGFRRQTR